jgi:putative ABC transport system permease protein
VGFAFPYAADVWLPLAIGSRDGDEYRAQRNFSAIARMKPGVTLARAQSDMDTIAARLVQAYAAFHRGWNVRVVPLGEFFLGQTRPGFLALAGAVVFVLMIACANVANLLLVRGAARRREMAIRTALGAGRRRLVRQMLTEGTLLAMAGAGAGLLLAVWGLEYLSSMLPAQAPAPRRLEIDGRVLVFTLGLSLLTGLVIGLFPALQISSWAQNAGRTGSPGKQRFRNALVVTQIALALVLLAGAALMIETLVRLRQIDPGFHPENRLTARVSLPYFRYADPQSRIRFFRQLLDSIEQLPGVRSAGGVFPLPFSDERQSIGFTIEGNPPSPPDQQPYANFRAVTPGYFRSMGIQLREGRLFTAADTPETERVAIVNETMAHTFWPDEDPIGRRMIIQSGVRVPSRIVGVVGDVRHAGLDAASGPEYYVPYFQRSQYTTLFLVIHSGSDPAQLAGAIRSQVRALDPEQPLADVRAMENLVGASLAPRRFYLLLLGLFSGLALLLAAFGIYGVASYSAAQRTHEIGIRMALGAEPSRMLRLVLRQGAVLAASGVALGLALAAALTRVLATLLYGISATDPRIFAAVASILMLVALAACYLPARRATRIAPMEALRYE